MRRIRIHTKLIVGLLAVSLVPLLSACRAEEQNRITMYEPGEYLGSERSELSQSQVRALRHRASGQSGATKPSGGGGGQVSVGEVDAGSLVQRTSNQGGS